MAITYGNEPLITLATELGFADQAHMSREIKRWFGVSPGELRAKTEAFSHLFNSPDAFRR